MVRFRTTEANANELKRLAEYYARSEADVLRLLIEEAARMVSVGRAPAIGAPHAVSTP